MNPDELKTHGEWITEFAFFLLLAVHIATLVRTFRGDKRTEEAQSQMRSSEERDLALSTRMNQLELRLENLRQEVRQEQCHAMDGLNARFERLEDRLNEVLAAVSELKGRRDHAGE